VGLSRRYLALRRSPLAGRATRYTIGSIVAAVVSEIAFAACFGGGLGTTPSTVIAFVAGAIPNWTLNRRWAWRRTGRLNFRREVAGYALTSVVSLVAAAVATGWVNHWVHSLTHDHTIRVIMVTAAYLATYGVLFVAKFAVYEMVIFTERRRPEPAG
jgi:putative flippase GtrA